MGLGASYEAFDLHQYQCVVLMYKLDFDVLAHSVVDFTLLSC
jgi:hypothetical protein